MKSLLSENMAVYALQLPDSLAAAPHVLDPVEVCRFTRGQLLLALGEAQAGATVDVIVQHAGAVGGGYTTFFTATQLTQAGGDDEAVYYLDLDLLNPNLKPWLRVTVTVGTDAVEGMVMLLLTNPRTEPVTQPDIVELAGTWATGILVPA